MLVNAVERLRSRPSNGSRVVTGSLPAVGTRPLQKAGGLLYRWTPHGFSLSLCQLCWWTCSCVSRFLPTQLLYLSRVFIPSFLILPAAAFSTLPIQLLQFKKLCKSQGKGMYAQKLKRGNKDSAHEDELPHWLMGHRTNAKLLQPHDPGAPDWLLAPTIELWNLGPGLTKFLLA